MCAKNLSIYRIFFETIGDGFASIFKYRNIHFEVRHGIEVLRDGTRIGNLIGAPVLDAPVCASSRGPGITGRGRRASDLSLSRRKVMLHCRKTSIVFL